MENQVEIKNTLKTNPLAVASLVLSIGGLSFLPLIGSIAGVVTGYMARDNIRQNPAVYNGEGLAKAGIILGWIGIVLLFVVVLLILVTFLFFVSPSSILIR
ncbi:MAG: DUF4190 domain-containing protein [Chloroflexota bacterium]